MRRRDFLAASASVLPFRARAQILAPIISGSALAPPPANLAGWWVADDITSIDSTPPYLRYALAWPNRISGGPTIAPSGKNYSLYCYEEGPTAGLLTDPFGHRFVFGGAGIPISGSYNRRDTSVFIVSMGRVYSDGDPTGSPILIDNTNTLLTNWIRQRKIEMYNGGLVDTGFTQNMQRKFEGWTSAAGGVTVYQANKTKSLSTIFSSGTSTSLQIGSDSFGTSGYGYYEILVYTTGSPNVSAIKTYCAAKYHLSLSSVAYVACDGDSLSTSYSQPDRWYSSFPQQMAGLLPTWTMDSVAYINRTAATMASELRANAVLDLTNYPTSVVVVWGGTNDLYGGATPAATLTSLKACCASYKSAGWTKVVIGTCLPRSNGGTPVGFEANRQTLNAAIRAEVSPPWDAIADVGADATIGAPGASANTTYYADLVHLTRAGDAIAAPIFAAQVP